jgi:hypothetical protein
MAVETAGYIADLNANNPSREDFINEGDEHLRLLKHILLETLLNADGPFDLGELYQARTIPGTIITWYGSAVTIPDGYGICDGSTYDLEDGSGTITSPDLRKRMVVGADPRDSSYDWGHTNGDWVKTFNTNASGNHTHSGGTNNAGGHGHGGTTAYLTLDLAHIPAHNHGGGNHVHWYTYNQLGSIHTGTSVTRNVGITPNAYTVSVGSGTVINTEGSGLPHRHGISGDGVHAHSLVVYSGGSHTHSMSANVAPPTYSLYLLIKL